jgi:chorismate mutase
MTTAVNSPDTRTSDSPSNSDGEHTIPMLREQIDALDAALIQLVAERARVSRRIQTARMNAGGTRVELGRERTVLASYRAGLGPEGPTLADAVLQVCLGAR